ncbi:hypothetical protein J6590_053169 [Homalodisca vitripennis]|nr:hypothetical protein J6590_053169 [Homalodisca vitripennis]
MVRVFFTKICCTSLPCPPQSLEIVQGASDTERSATYHKIAQRGDVPQKPIIGRNETSKSAGGQPPTTQARRGRVRVHLQAIWSVAKTIRERPWEFASLRSLRLNTRLNTLYTHWPNNYANCTDR